MDVLGRFQVFVSTNSFLPMVLDFIRREGSPGVSGEIRGQPGTARDVNNCYFVVFCVLGGVAMAEVTHIRREKNYTVGEAGPLEHLDAKLFVGRAMGFTGMEVSLNRFVPGQSVPYVHQHRKHEEMYLFIKGQGQFQIDGDLIEVGPGTVLRVLPDAMRAWRNNSQEDLYCIVIQANMDSLTGQDGIRHEGEPEWPAS